MNYLDIDDTIIAQCTSEGKSSVDIVRMSGKNLKSIYKKITRAKKNPRPNQILKKNIYINKKLLDVALISYFQTPNSFTGEDVVEINCHGGDFIASNIIKYICKKHGVRVALPGEFSFRAYYYGKIDLVQAEAINDIINSETNIYANKSLENINGRLSEKILEIKKMIVQTLQVMEHELDFNEGEISFTKKEDFIKNIELIIKALSEIGDSMLYSNLIRGGIRVALIGRPNAGKSSLFNYLMGFNRAIVSDQPGTTRDTIESVLDINGYKVKFIDTAGYWESKNAIEKIGIEKTKEEIFQADILLFLGESKSDLMLIKEFNVDKNIIKILSKSDINIASGYDVSVSSKGGVGVNKLLTLLSTNMKLILKDRSHQNNFLINSRQETILLSLLEQSKQIKLEIESNVSYDVVAYFLHDFLDSLNEIINPVNRGDILNNVFANFCVGK